MNPFSGAMDLINNGKAYTVFIDDTGSKNSANEDVVRYVGVIINPELSKEIPEIINLLLKTLNKTVKATEFHFSDIYQGQGEFRGTDYKLRLEIIRRFVEVFNKIIKPAIFVQSMDAKTAEAIYQGMDIPNNITFSDLAKFYAFSGLLARIHEYLKETIRNDNKAIVFCDNGIKNSGIALGLPIELDTIYNNSIFFIDSKQHPGIQLADFAAFMINRQQILLQKERLSDKDTTFMFTIQPLIQFFQNTTNIQGKASLNPEFHIPYILKNQVEKYGKRTAIISDTRTGIVVVAEPQKNLNRKNKQ